MKTQIIKWGSGLAVQIPKAAAEEARLKEGDFLEISTREGWIDLRLVGAVPTLGQLITRITKDNRYSEVAAGMDAGREAVEW